MTPQAATDAATLVLEAHMRAAWYERQGPPQQVLRVGTIPDPTPGLGEVRIRIAASGINPGDIKTRQSAFGYGMPYPRVIPHSDGAGVIDQVGDGVSTDLVGRRVWCYGAQTYRPFGTAAEYTVVPASQAVPLPDGVSFEPGGLRWDSRDYGASWYPRAPGRWPHRARAGWRRCRWHLCRAARAPCWCACHRDGPFRRG